VKKIGDNFFRPFLFQRRWLLLPFVKGGGEGFKKAIFYLFQKDDITRFRARFRMTLLESWPVSRSSKQIFEQIFEYQIFEYLDASTLF
jgi:hypothetical protein